MNKQEFLKNPYHHWFDNGNYGSDGQFMYRFDKYGKLVSKQRISTPWLTDWGAANFEQIKYYW